MCGEVTMNSILSLRWLSDPVKISLASVRMQDNPVLDRQDDSVILQSCNASFEGNVTEILPNI